VRLLTTSIRLVRRKVLASLAEIEMHFFKCCGPSPEPRRKEEIAACIWV